MIESTSFDIHKAITEELIPKKFGRIYEQQHKGRFNGNSLLVYFNEKSKKFCASTTTMLRAMINMKHNKDINQKN
ncbi:unnamed protein product [Tenebrio molitor]|nr:unnamed protein product [Tenebrio molitor]